MPDPPAFETDKPQRVRDSENNEEKKAVLQNEGTEAEVEQKSKNIDKLIDTGLGETDDQVVEGDADDVEGVSNDLNSFLQESEGGTTGGSSSSSSSGGTTVVDPRDELKNKQKEALNTNNQRRRNRRGRRTSSSFLETPSSVENIKESVTPNNLDTGSNRGELVASVEITDEMKAQALSPVKKEVNIPSNRKSKNKIIIVEKQSGNGNQSITMPSNGSSKTIVKAVDDEKLLMKMQSTSTLKYT